MLKAVIQSTETTVNTNSVISLTCLCLTGMLLSKVQVKYLTFNEPEPALSISRLFFNMSGSLVDNIGKVLIAVAP